VPRISTRVQIVGSKFNRIEQSENVDASNSHKNSSADCCTPDFETSRSDRATDSSAESVATVRSQYRISNMDCPTEEALIRNRLERIPQVAKLEFDLLDRVLTVQYRGSDTQVVEDALLEIGMEAKKLSMGVAVHVTPPAISTRLIVLLAISGITALGAEILAWRSGEESSLPVILLAVVSILSGGLPTLKKGWVALRNITLNIYFLMSLAVIGAMILGQWPEAAMVVFLFAIAEAIEALSLERARNAIKSLTALAPDIAYVYSDKKWLELPVSEVTIGSKIRVRVGERVPLDATVSSGNAALNQAPITGESMPIDKSSGDGLYAGSTVVDGIVEALTISTASNSTLSRVAAAIQEAQSQRAPTQRFVDKFASYYTPIIVAIAAAVAILGPLLFSGSWSTWFYQALVLLVIACPCALVISTPITVVSGLAAAAKHGILIKGGTYLEQGRFLKVLALDKTGTLTKGEPALTDVTSVSDMPVERSLLIAASLDESSTHPVAQAIVNGWQQRQSGQKLLAVENFRVLNGRGVKGTIAGEQWYLGNHRLVEEMDVCSTDVERQLSELEIQGKTAIALMTDKTVMAILAVADAVRPESQAAINTLTEMNIIPVMLTGDNPDTANAIAKPLGIKDVRANLLPEEKQAAVVTLKKAHGVIGMVGDGVNDAPALARADIGFAMGAAGTATALETADVAIMDDDPRKLGAFIAISRHSSSVLKQNITLALGIKFVFLVLAITGHATLWMAVFADMGASLLVVFNGLRVLNYYTAFKPIETSTGSL